MSTLKLLIKEILRCLLFLFRLFPVKKNRIVLESWGGNGIGCNPLLLYEYIKKTAKGEDVELVWVVNFDNFSKENGTKYVKNFSMQYFLHVLTAKVYVTNIGGYAYLPFREEQIVLNTWHAGVAYKKIERDFYKFQNLQAYLYNKSLNHINESTTYILSANAVTTGTLSSAWGFPKNKFICSGLPRNDIFFHSSQIEERGAFVRERLGINKESFIVIYAPTFRNSTGNPFFEWELNIKILLEKIKARFSKEVVLLYRLHMVVFMKCQKVKQKIEEYTDSFNIKDVSAYPEMQDLLCAADMLITDYSSSAWDYSFTYRPCFLFTPDLEKYKANTGLYTPIEEWGFPICRSNEELWEQIENFDEERFKQAIIHHHEAFGSYERGTATEEIGKLILSHIN